MSTEIRQQKIKLKKITLDELAVMMQRGFVDLQKQMDERFAAVDYELSVLRQTMATKDDICSLDAHIGRFERRFQNIEEIVLQDHSPRIRALEEEVGI